MSTTNQQVEQRTKRMQRWRQGIKDDGKYKHNTVLYNKINFLFLRFPFPSSFVQSKYKIQHLCNIFLEWHKALRHLTWHLFMSESVQNVCQNDRSKMILQINEVCSASCQRISCSWHLLGLTDAPLGCLAGLLSESARLTSRPRIWLAVEIESDGNWLHITCLKKVSGQWGIKKVWEQKRRGHPYLSQQPSSRSVHCRQAPGGEGEGKGAGQNRDDWQREGQSWQLNRADG